MIRFRVQLRVIDESGHGLFTMFNHQMEHLIDSTANKFVNRIGICSSELPAEFGGLIRKILAFTIRLSDLLNPDVDFHNPTVVRVTEVEPFPLLPPPPPIDTHEKGKRKKTVAAFPVSHKDPGPSSRSYSCGTAGSTCAGYA